MIIFKPINEIFVRCYEFCNILKFQWNSLSGFDYYYVAKFWYGTCWYDIPPQQIPFVNILVFVFLDFLLLSFRKISKEKGSVLKVFKQKINVSFANIPVIDKLFSGIHQLDLNGTWQELDHPGPAVVDQGFHHHQRVYPQLARRKFHSVFRLLKL